MTDALKGLFTFRFAAVCFGLSVVGEMYSLQDPVLLFGALVGGVVMLAYHLVYAALFALLAGGLWNGWPSTYYTLFATAVLYTVDRLQLVFFGEALEMEIRRQFRGYEEILATVDMRELLQILDLTIVAFVLGWWGFVAYAYFRRRYFDIR